MSKQKLTTILNSIIFLLVLLWIYTAVSKLMNIHEFERQLKNQVFGKVFTQWLFWLIPITEISAAIMLVFNSTKIYGLVLSLILMALFTGYIGLVLLNFYPRIPCSCGGVLKNLGWHAHFWFNLFFLCISALGIYTYRKLSIIR